MPRFWACRSRNRLLGLLLVLSLYPTALLGYVWYHCWHIGLPGGENGPLDAYRHMLASALLAYTAKPVAVTWVTNAMEFRNRPANLMDRHNNAIGAKIGNGAHSLAQIEPQVRARVTAGVANAPLAMQATWLPQQQWQKSFFW